MAAESQTLEALFPGARRTVLTALFAEPHRWWTLEELAGRAGVRPGSIQTQLFRLRASGIVLEDREGSSSALPAQPGVPDLRRTASYRDETHVGERR